MTDQGPATPGTAALDLNKWDTCPCGSPSGPEFRYGLCDPCAERTPASALLRMGQFFGNAALAAPKSTPELERLKAENASLRSMSTALGKQCAELERDRDYNAALRDDAVRMADAAEAENASLRGSLRIAEELGYALALDDAISIAYEAGAEDICDELRALAALRAAGRGDEEAALAPSAKPPPGSGDTASAARAAPEAVPLEPKFDRTHAETFEEARAALHDEERSAPPPEEKTPTCLNCGKEIATGWVLAQMNDGRLGVLCEQCRPNSSRAEPPAARPSDSPGDREKQ